MSTSADVTKKRLQDLLEYGEELARILHKPTMRLGQYPLHLLEAEFLNLPGIQLGHDDAWIAIERLHKIDPPVPPEEISDWLEVGSDPTKEPVCQEELLVRRPRDEIEQLLADGVVEKADVMQPLRAEDDETVEEADVVLRIKNLPEVRAQVVAYTEGPWREWSEREVPRRQTIKLYNRLFAQLKEIEDSLSSSPLEVVLGAGVLAWQNDGRRIKHPVVEFSVDLSLEEAAGTINVNPRDVSPQIYAEPLLEMDVPVSLRKQLTETLGQVLSDATSPDEEGDGAGERGPEPNPLEPVTLDRIFHLVAARAAETGVVVEADDLDEQTRQTLPVSETLTVYPTWSLYFRPRSSGTVAEDLLRYRQSIDDEDFDLADVPAAVTSFITTAEEQIDEEDPRHPKDGGGGSEGGPREDAEVLFPKPFNDRQLNIVKLLDKAAGVVVQGPPGTGKTHTIANVICHYLAQGKRILVTSHGLPALEVLKQHIPSQIRQLVVSLLGSDREGAREAEAAVRFIRDEIANVDKAQTIERISELETRMAELKQDLLSIEGQIASFASRQAKAIPADLLPDVENRLPVDAARVLVGERESFSWFPDELKSTAVPPVSDAEVKRLGELRVTVGEHLPYLDIDLPTVQDLPDVASLLKCHDELLRDQDAAGEPEEDLPPIASNAERVDDRARELLSHLDLVIEEMGNCESSPWLKQFFDNTLNQDEKERLKAIIVRVDHFSTTIRACGPKLDYPRGTAANQHALRTAIERAANGKRPFSFFSFNGQVKQLFSQIRWSSEAPKTPKDWQQVLAFSGFAAALPDLARDWSKVADRLKLPGVNESEPAWSNFEDRNSRALDTDQLDPVQAADWFLRVLSRIGAASKVGRVARQLPSEVAELFPYGIDSAQTGVDLAATKRCRAAAAAHIASLTPPTPSIARIAAEKLAGYANPLCDKMRIFLSQVVGEPGTPTRNVQEAWAEQLDQLRHILGLEDAFIGILESCDRIEAAGAVRWATVLRTEVVAGAEDPWTCSDWGSAWRLRRLDGYLDEIGGRSELQRLNKRREDREQELERVMNELVQQRTFRGMHETLTDARLSALSKYVQAVARIGKGTGKRAYRHRREAREALKACEGAIPCWVMPEWRISDLPSEFALFDLVIVDEASQSNILALPAILRASRVLIVGDDKQVSPSAVGIEEKKILQLQTTFLGDQPHRAAFAPDYSLYDVGQVAYPGTRIMLNEHFRCVDSIIQFSTRFYDEEIFPVRLPKPSERIDPPLVDVFVKNGLRPEPGDTNPIEAEAVVREVEAIVANPRFSGRSIGVVSLFNNTQAELISQMLLDRLGSEVYEKRKILCGYGPTFQGNERDIILLSMVVSAGRCQALTRRQDEQRLNVALSRARDRMYLFRSVSLDDLPNPNDLRRQVVEFFQEDNDQNRNQDERSLCESDFELDVYDQLVKLGYRVMPQVRVGSFRIDMVIEGDEDARLAIELDGDKYHGPDRWLSDWKRQKILERAGWRFWRCWASQYYRDPDAALADLKELLETMRIHPLAGQAPSRQSREFREVEIDIAEPTPPTLSPIDA